MTAPRILHATLALPAQEPEHLSDEQIIQIAMKSPINEMYWLAKSQEGYAEEVAEITAFCRAVIAARI